MTPQDLIDFEDSIAQEFEEGKLPYPIHYSGRGNEQFLIDLFESINPDDWVFSTWRNHYHALLKGIPADVLRDKIRAGDSMHIISKEHNFFAGAIVGGCCPIAVGVALQIQRTRGNNKVVCFLGDGGEDQGVFYESVRYAWAWRLPIVFVIEDNGLSVDTTSRERNNDMVGDWPANVSRYHYKRYWPHVQTGKIIQTYM